jgi:transposase
MVEAMIYVMRLGCPWRDIPEHFGPWSSVYTRWRRWNSIGLWKAILDLLSTLESGQLRHLDATHVKVHQDASSGGHHETEAIGRSKGGVNTKITALVDGFGRALQVELEAGNRADIKAVGAIEIPTGKQIVADKGYDSDKFRETILSQGSKPCIPPRSNRVNRTSWNRRWYKKRHHVENFFQRIKRWRRIGTRYDKLATCFLSFVQLAAILDWIK